MRCTGLVAGERYRIAARVVRAGRDGTLFAGAVAVRGGQTVTLVNAAGRRLTTLHVAHLRVDLIGDQTVIASGSCQPGDFYGRPLSHAPTASTVGIGPGGGGTACPDNGRAAGLSTADIAQTDDRSGGQTVTQVPTIASTAPGQDDTLYGRFIASAQSSLPGAHGSTAAAGTPIALSIRPAGSRHRVFHAANVDTRHGVPVPALAAGHLHGDVGPARRQRRHAHADHALHRAVRLAVLTVAARRGQDETAVERTRTKSSS